MKNAISLFSSSGIGDLGLRANNIDTVIACELLFNRAELFKSNNPHTKMFQGDIWNLQSDIIDYYKTNYRNQPFIILATPPCQGMSTNGAGRIKNSYLKGKRPKMDERNRLILPTINIIKELQPEWVILENVSNMRNTYIYDTHNNLINIIEYIKSSLSEYTMWSEVLDTADYGLAQHRKRLLTVLGKNKSVNDFVFPNKCKPSSLREAIGSLPPLRSEKGKNENPNIPLHKVPELNNEKLFWIHNTAEGDTAFNNQCNQCGCLSNINHLDIYCRNCGKLLPRPTILDVKTGKRRLIKGFDTSYKRMKWDEPSGTLTQNFQVVSSDNKIHPAQDRPLSIYEGLILQGISKYDYSFKIDGKYVPDKLTIDTIGESVCPLLIDLIVQNIMKEGK